METKNIAILGSTGSIGRQTLDIIDEYPNLFKAWALVANTSADLLVQQALKYLPEYVVIADERLYPQVKTALAGTNVNVLTGSESICQVAAHDKADLVVTAMVGFSGLKPTVAAIKAGKDIALANKETLVVAGEIITRLQQQHDTNLYPVDSEHGAFWQCLLGENRGDVSKLLLTASGGPFRTWSKDRILQATLADALNHPNWSMGKKITIDSATMMNKGFEMIEARWLYDVEPDRIQVVVHPQSIVHSMVEFVDGSVKAQLGLPDMHLPIRYAMGLPGRLASNSRKMTIEDYSNLTFERPDFDKFPLLGLAYESAKAGGNTPCVLNAANEIAVARFLQGEIRFVDIANLVQSTIESATHVSNPTLDDLFASNDEAREIASNIQV